LALCQGTASAVPQHVRLSPLQSGFRSRLPTGFGHAGNLTLKRQLPEA
jgi:hypothetical protein